MVLLVLSGTNIHAQQPARPRQTSPKDELVQKLNDFQPKMTDLDAKAKDNAAKRPDFVAEVSNLNNMVSAFKTKLDKFDITPSEHQSEYAASLQSDWSAIESQYKKAMDLWSTGHPNDELSQQKDDQKPPK